MGRPPTGPPLTIVYQRLRSHFGPQGWWPAESPFEVCVGAILVQNTAWRNVERAIGNLRRRQLLDPALLFAIPETELQELLRPAGTFRIKAARLREFLRVLMARHDGSLEQLFAGPTEQVRQRLLEISGIGPETADCLLLYAGGKPSFVIDAYTRRVFRRHHWPNADASYDQLQQSCATALTDESDSVALWQDFHAQMVAVGKHYCRSAQPQCAGCPLEEFHPEVSRQTTASFRARL